MSAIKRRLLSLSAISGLRGILLTGMTILGAEYLVTQVKAVKAALLDNEEIMRQ
jgi:hypothetical protein